MISEYHDYFFGLYQWYSLIVFCSQELPTAFVCSELLQTAH